jgi:hypothetical protein
MVPLFLDSWVRCGAQVEWMGLDRAIKRTLGHNDWKP